MRRDGRTEVLPYGQGGAIERGRPVRPGGPSAERQRPAGMQRHARPTESERPAGVGTPALQWQGQAPAQQAGGVNGR